MLGTDSLSLISNFLSDTCVSGLLPPYTSNICISDYSVRVREYYSSAQPTLDRLCLNPDFGPVPTHFGVTIAFDRPVDLRLYDDDWTIDDRLRTIIRTHGVVKLVNATPIGSEAAVEQHNIFPSLQFHVDRAGKQPNQISMFVREKANPMHFEPRASQTLFVANAVAHLQALRENKEPTDRRNAVYRIFDQAPIADLLDHIVLNHTWQAPPGSGEIVLFDNRDVLHASYYPNERGYPIGVRYLY